MNSQLECSIVFALIIIGGIIIFNSILFSDWEVLLVFIGFFITFTNGVYFYYRMDNPRPKFLRGN